MLLIYRSPTIVGKSKTRTSLDRDGYDDPVEIHTSAKNELIETEKRDDILETMDMLLFAEK